jgi:hypothetical protein
LLLTYPTQSTSKAQADSTSEAAKTIECKVDTIEKVLQDEEPSIQETIFQMIMVILPKKNPQFSLQTRFVY